MRFRALGVLVLIPCLSFCGDLTSPLRKMAGAADKTTVSGPSISITGAPDSLKVGDTAAVTAMPMSVIGRKSPSSRLSWNTRPQGFMSVTCADTKCQHVTFKGLDAATVYAVATWNRSDGLIVKDSVRVVVWKDSVIVVPPPDTVPKDTVPTDTTTPPPPIVDTTAHLAELPRVYLNTAVSNTPSLGKQWHVPAGANLQAVIDSAAPGDQILLAAGATYIGNFTVSPKSGGISGGWLTIATEGCSTLPPENVRVTPSAASCYAKLVSNTVLPSLATSGPVSRLRVIGVEFTPDPSQTVSQAIVQLGSSGSDQNSLSLVPSNIILDRVYVHGNPTVDDRKCVTLNVASGAVVDSYIRQCHSVFDSQAITLTNGPGPFKIVNNFLDAAAENIAIGGAVPWVPNLIPADFEIRHNYFYKDPANFGVWQTKNIIEFKVGLRVLIDGNVLENSYVDAQAGFAFMLWNANSGCSWCQAGDFTITNNLIRNVAGGWNLAEHYDLLSGGSLHNMTMINNLIIGLNQSTGNGRVLSVNDSIANVVFEHNTGFGSEAIVVGSSTPKKYRQTILNNLLSTSYFSGYGVGTAAWSLFADSGSVNTNNVYEGASDWFNVIPGNWQPQTYDALGLVGGATAATSVTASITDMGLSSSSPYIGKGTDGKDIGVDINKLLIILQGVITP